MDFDENQDILIISSYSANSLKPTVCRKVFLGVPRDPWVLSGLVSRRARLANEFGYENLKNFGRGADSKSTMACGSPRRPWMDFDRY